MKRSLELGRPPERVWPWIEDPARQKQWMKGLEENSVVGGGTARVGSRILMRIREGRRTSSFDGEITALDRPRHLGIRFWGGSFPKGTVMSVDYRLVDLGGRTRLDYEGSCELKGFWMRLLAPLFKIFGGLQLNSFLRTLKRLVEAE